MKRNEELLNNTIIIAIGTFTTKLLSFLLVPFYTIWLSPEDYGTYDLLVTYISFVIPFITVQLEQAIFRFCMEQKSKAKKYYSNAMQIVLFNMIICNVLIFLLMKKSDYLLSFVLYFNAYAIYTCSSEYLRGIGKLKLYSLINIIVSFFIVGFNIVFVYLLKYQVNGMLLSYGLANMIGVIIILAREKLIDLDTFKLKDRHTKYEMIKYSLPLIPNSISWWITNVSDRTIINWFLGSFYNGIYAVACKIPLIVNLFFSVFNLSWQQIAIVTLNDDDKKDYYNSIYDSLLKFLYSSGFCILILSTFIFKFVLDREYYEGIKQIPFLLNGVIFLSLAQFLSGIFLANKDTKNVGKSTIIAAIVNLCVNLIFIKLIGLYAASISTLISYIVMFLGRFWKLKDMFNYKIIIKNILIYNFFFFLLSILVSYDNLIFNIFLLLISIIFFIAINMKLLGTLINKIFRRKKE